MENGGQAPEAGPFHRTAPEAFGLRTKGHGDNGKFGRND